MADDAEKRGVDLELARTPFPAVRLIAGTTVSLRDRIGAGTFSDRLFYRLNTIHLLAENANGATGPEADRRRLVRRVRPIERQ